MTVEKANTAATKRNNIQPGSCLPGNQIIYFLGSPCVLTEGCSDLPLQFLYLKGSSEIGPITHHFLRTGASRTINLAGSTFKITPTDQQGNEIQVEEIKSEFSLEPQ